MNQPIVIVGEVEFIESIVQKSGKNLSLQGVAPKDYKLINNEDVVFFQFEQSSFSQIEQVLKSGRHLALFRTQRATVEQLTQLLNLSIESNSWIVNGDSLFFNPAVYEVQHDLKEAEIATIASNQMGFISRRSIFNCLELILKLNDSPVRAVRSKAVRLDDQFLNFIHLRVEFENGNLGVLEMTNCKPKRELLLETVGDGHFVHIDLLTFNGQKHKYDGRDSIENLYPKQRNAMSLVLGYMENEMSNQVSSHHQFFNAIKTAELMNTIEEQLRREMPRFTTFVDD